MGGRKTPVFFRYAATSGKYYLCILNSLLFYSDEQPHNKTLFIKLRMTTEIPFIRTSRLRQTHVSLVCLLTYPQHCGKLGAAGA